MDVLKYHPERGGWIGFDLDRTLATYRTGMGPCEIGEPIPLMIETAKAYIAEGWEVRVFTARVCSTGAWAVRVPDIKRTIREWTLQHIGAALESTAEKDWMLVRLYDDRAVQVEAGTGMLLLDAAEQRLTNLRASLRATKAIGRRYISNDAAQTMRRMLREALDYDDEVR